MNDSQIKEELKKRTHPIFRVIKDPQTGHERWEEDMTATSFSYDSRELERWIKEGAIPKKLAKHHLKEIKEGRLRCLAGMEMVEKLRNEGREPTAKDWASVLKPLSKEDIQNSVSFHNFLMENREMLLQVLQPTTPKKIKYRQGGHYIDQKTKVQQENFDSLRKETKNKMAELGLQVKTEGIRLTPPQDKLLNALMKLLYEKSETKDEKSDRFYGGNCEVELVPYGGGKLKGRSATLRIFPCELYKAYLDRNEYSGADIRHIKTLLQDTEQQKFLITYDRRREITNKKGKKEKVIDRIEEFQSLISIVRFFEGLTAREAKALDNGSEDLRERRGELIIRLNPLLTDQINSKYVEYPEDINRRTIIAAGGHKQVTESVNALRDYLLREISAKRQSSSINEDTLIYTLKLDSYLKAQRKSRIKVRIQSAIQAAKNLGLLTNYECVQGAKGQWKYIFHLNLKFYD